MHLTLITLRYIILVVVLHGVCFFCDIINFNDAEVDISLVELLYLNYNCFFMRLRNLCILAPKRQFQMYADFIYARLYMGCGYPTVDI